MDVLTQPALVVKYKNHIFGLRYKNKKGTTYILLRTLDNLFRVVVTNVYAFFDIRPLRQTLNPIQTRLRQ